MTVTKHQRVCNLFLIKSSLEKVEKSNYFYSNPISDELIYAFDTTAQSTLSLELAYSMVHAFENRKIISAVAHRVGVLLETVRFRLYNITTFKTFDTKLMTILNETSSHICDYVEEEFAAPLAMEVVNGIMKAVFGWKGASANSIFRILSYVTIAPENTGMKRMAGMNRKDYVHQLIEVAIRTSELDLKDVHESFLRSPSLKTLFICRFNFLAKVGNLASEYVSNVSNYLGMAGNPEKNAMEQEEQEEQKEEQKEEEKEETKEDDETTLLGVFLERVISTEELDSLLQDESNPDGAIPAPHGLVHAEPRLHDEPCADILSTPTKTQTSATPPTPTFEKSKKHKKFTAPNHGVFVPLGRGQVQSRLHFRIQKGRITKCSSSQSAESNLKRALCFDASDLLCTETLAM